MKKVLCLFSLTLLLLLTVTIFQASAQVSPNNSRGGQFSEKNAFGRGIGFPDKGGFGGSGGFGDRSVFGGRGGFGDKGKEGPQDKDGGDGGGTNAPLDGWLGLLLAAGLGLGLKKTMDRNKALRLKSINIPD